MADLNSQAADLERKLENAKEDLAGLQQQMTKMKERMKEKLLEEWPSPWQNEQIVNTKVMGRLTEDKDYKALILKIRETEQRVDDLEARLRAQQPGGDPTLGDPNPKSHGYMPSAPSAAAQTRGYMPTGKEG
jgi:uncharacterized coiled-coil protein SlyX